MNSISNSSVIKDSIPKNIIQTYSHKHKIPEKVFLNIAKFAPDYKHLVFDDDDCIEFLRSNYSEHYVSIFNSYPRGAHKSDFFRYSYLYLKGGFYLDTDILFRRCFLTNFIISRIFCGQLLMNSGW